MDEHFIVTVYVTLEEICQQFLGQVKYKPKMTAAEILLVAIIAARYFNNNLERALLVLSQTGHIPARRRLSISRYNRQLHRHLDTFELCQSILLELGRYGDAFVLDSMPVPVCKRKRARRCRKVNGRLFCGYCAAKEEKFFGWRLHLVCNPEGLPVHFIMLPASLHDLTPIYELSYDLPQGAALYTDKAYNDADAEDLLASEGLRLIPIRRKNMKHQHDWADEYDLRRYRKGIETVNSQLESMGINRLRARTNDGFFIKVQASLIALWHTQALAN
jgi:IS5 family transposase